MYRRTFLTLTAATLLMPFAAQAEGPLDYTPGLVKDRLAAGDTVLLDFKAAWCSTCRAQEQVINDLRRTNPAYDQAITFVNVDWDQYKRAALTKSLNIPRRSTLVALKGEDEIGRIVADVRKKNIKALLDAALTAAQSS